MRVGIRWYERLTWALKPFKGILGTLTSTYRVYNSHIRIPGLRDHTTYIKASTAGTRSYVIQLDNTPTDRDGSNGRLKITKRFIRGVMYRSMPEFDTLRLPRLPSWLDLDIQNPTLHDSPRRCACADSSEAPVRIAKSTIHSQSGYSDPAAPLPRPLQVLAAVLVLVLLVVMVVVVAAGAVAVAVAAELAAPEWRRRRG